MLLLSLALLATPAQARYALTDLLKPGKHQADVMTLGLDPSLNPLFNKYAAALKNSALMADVMAKTKPGQPMPYDPRFNMTEAEYARLGAGLKAVKLLPTGQKTELTIEQLGDSITVKNDSCSPLRGGAKFDKATALVSLAGFDPIRANYFENHSADSPLAPFDGYSYHPALAGKRLELAVGRRTQENFCIVSCTLKDGVANEDVLLRYDCVSAAAAAPAAPASSGDDVLAGFEKLAQSQTKADVAKAPPPAVAPAPAAVVAPAAPPPASAVPVPRKITDKSPPTICRGALNRYPHVTPSLFSDCKEANEHSAQVMNVYTYIYKGMGADLIHAILRVKTQEQEDCATQIAKQYGGYMPTKYFIDTCL